MELFSLLAKLTLDSKEFDKGLSEAQREADNFEMPETPSLDLDTDDFESNVASAESLGEGFGSSMESIFGQIKTALTVTGITAAIAGIVNGLKEAVNMAAETADGIDKGSKRLNISRQAYQGWDHALRQSGASISDLQKGVIQFNKFIADNQPGAVVKDAEEALEGSGNDMAQAFARLKINIKDDNNQLKTTEQLINESLIALAGFNGSKEERGALVTQLFGKGGNNLNALLDEGVDGVKALLAEAENLGLIMSDDEINNAVAYGDAVANLNAELDAIKIAFVQDIIPVLKDCVDWLTGFLTKLNPRLQTSSIFDVFNQIDAKAILASARVDEANATAKKLIKDLQELGNYWTLDEEGRMTWDALADKALDLFPQLSDYIDKDGKKIQGNTKDIEANIDAWSRLEKQRLLSNAMAEKEEAVAKQLTAAYEKGAEAREKQAEIQGKLNTAMKEAQRYFNEGAGKPYQDYLKSLGYNGTMTEDIFRQIMPTYTTLLDEGGYRDTQAEKTLEIWQKTIEEAQTLREEAEEMKEKANAAKDSLKQEQEYLMEEMGLTQEEIKKSTNWIGDYINKINQIPTDVFTTIHQIYEQEGFPHAIGSAYIPYDNYPALLHRGERILTATEARRGTGDGIDYTRLEDSIVASIRAGMADANVTAVITDREVGKSSNRYNGTEIDSRRFRP